MSCTENEIWINHFADAAELGAYASKCRAVIERERAELGEDYLQKRMAEMKARFERDPTPEETAERQRELERQRDLWEWVSAHNDRYTGHPYKGAYDAFYEASMQDIGDVFAYDKISLIGEIDQRMPEGENMRFAIWRLIKGDMWVDLAHEFFMPPSWLVRINSRILPDGAMRPFLSQDRTSPHLLDALPPLQGQQTVFAVDDTKDLHAVLTLLIGKTKRSDA